MRARPPILILLLPLSVTPALAGDKAVEKELQRHQGTWTTTSSIHDGQEAPGPTRPLDRADRRERPRGLEA